MSWKHQWDYHEAQTSIIERLHKEWTPPAAPCATPSTSLATKRNGTLVPNCEEEKSKPKKLKCDKVQQMRRCYTYNLQMNESHIFLSQKSCQDVRMHELKAKLTQVRLQKNNALSNSGVKREIIKPSELHYTVFQYSGPDRSHSGTTLVFKRAYPQKAHLMSSAHSNRLKDSPKPFHLELPQCHLRVGNVVPRQQAKILQQQQVKQNGHAAVNIIGL
ncbi:hypothetical protein XENTR_v10010881 [Xenopus tropicalis]|uniref:Uncharacterized protein LOC101733065 n=1 Tax=Xenopus tropicalis TaxID=8364 RepID=A0A8J0SML6_XENTR|eukprot:XP_012817649.1 PREDICTED: uncharacterized protein LOC101733065 [Xenopus tropicalis]